MTVHINIARDPDNPDVLNVSMMHDEEYNLAVVIHTDLDDFPFVLPPLTRTTLPQGQLDIGIKP